MQVEYRVEMDTPAKRTAAFLEANLPLVSAAIDSAREQDSANGPCAVILSSAPPRCTVHPLNYVLELLLREDPEAARIILEDMSPSDVPLVVVYGGTIMVGGSPEDED